MADKIVQLIDGRTNDNIFPVTTADAPVITVTSTDPGAGSALAANHFVAVTGSAAGYVGAGDISSNAITTVKIADDAVTADKINFATLGGNYSTTEQATNYTWIDGSMIYKKTIDCGYLTNNTTKSVAHNITNLKMYVRPVEAVMLDSAGTSCWDIPYLSVTIVAADLTNVKITAAGDLTAFKAYATLYYTKSA